MTKLRRVVFACCGAALILGAAPVAESKGDDDDYWENYWSWYDGSYRPYYHRQYRPYRFRDRDDWEDYREDRREAWEDYREDREDWYDDHKWDRRAWRRGYPNYGPGYNYPPYGYGYRYGYDPNWNYGAVRIGPLRFSWR